MKRKKISEACGEKSRNEEAEAVQVEIRLSGYSITNLPTPILAAILCRLPIKEIIVCKCISKSLYATISSPEFFQSEVIFPIARIVGHNHVSRILYRLELEQDVRSSSMDVIFSSQQFHDTKLKIPLCDFPLDNIDGNGEITLNSKDHGYKLLNSCNGFLCLSEPFRNNPVVVCNPVTGEFINLPRVADVVGCKDHTNDCCFGYSPKTNQYKVVRIFDLYSSVKYESGGRMAQVHVLGTGSWQNIQCKESLKNLESADLYPGCSYELSFPTYLNGAVHWFCHLEEKLIRMVSFDCEKECFLPFPLPPLTDDDIQVDVGMGVLGGCLCVCDSSNQTSVCVWLLKDYYGTVGKSWTRVFKIDMSCSAILLYGLYQPIKYMSNGAILMFNYPRGILVYYDPRKPDVKLFEFRPDRMFEIIPHTPNFTSLKAVLAGCNVEVLNVYSRCAGLKLNGEARAISLKEKNLGVHDDYEVEYLYHGRNSCYDYWWGGYADYPFSKIWVKPSN